MEMDDLDDLISKLKSKPTQKQPKLNITPKIFSQKQQKKDVKH